MSNEDEGLDAYIASQYNLMDHLTNKIYGDGVKYEQLSAFGQRHIEDLARLQPFSAPHDPELQQIRSESAFLREENQNHMDRIAGLLRELEMVYEELEILKDEQEDD